MSESVIYVDISISDQVWIQLKCAPGLLFGFCYIPPIDSPEFSHSTFGSIQEKLKTSEMRNGYFLIGDLNARIGRSVRQLPSRAELPNADSFLYPNIPDDVQSCNDNAHVLSTLCIDASLVVVNNL